MKNHSFDVAIATEFGVNAAILFQSIAWWCEHSRANNTHFHDGLYWTYNTNQAFQKLFPYLSGKQITLAIDKLVGAGLVVKGCYNKNPYDRTLWYAVTEKGIKYLEDPVNTNEETEESSFQKSQMEEKETANGSVENGEPIPVIYPVINTVKESSAKKQFAPPTVEEVEAYAKEKGFSPQEFSAEEFWSFYESKGWVVGKNKMKNWHAAVSHWVATERKRNKNRQNQRTASKQDYNPILNLPCF